jgi:microcystin-dependent protein
MANTIKPKRSYTTSAVPTLAAGELGINASTDGKIWIGNAAGTGVVLVASRQASDLVGTVAVASGGTGVTTSTGSGSVVLSTSPSLTTPTLGAATATTINKVTITSPATGATITITDGKTFSVSNTLTFTGTDSSSVAFGSGGTVLYSGGALGTPSSGTLTNCTFPILNQNTTGTASGLSATLAVSSGGTGLTTLTANNVILGNGTSTPTFVAPGTSGNLLTSNGTTWQSTAPAASASVPTGSLMPYAGSSAPTGYLLCDGSSVSSSTYLALHAVISNTYGGSAYTGGSGLNFTLPDLRGRLPMGAGTGVGLNASGTGAPSGTAQTARTRGQWLGEETHLLTTAELASHTHNNTVSGGSTGSMSANASHSHQQASRQGTSGGLYGLVDSSNSGSSGQPYVSTTNTDHTHTFTPSISNASAGSDNRHATIPPCVVLNYIIKT